MKAFLSVAIFFCGMHLQASFPRCTARLKIITPLVSIKVALRIPMQWRLETTGLVQSNKKRILPNIPRFCALWCRLRATVSSNFPQGPSFRRQSFIQWRILNPSRVDSILTFEQQFHLSLEGKAEVAFVSLYLIFETAVNENNLRHWTGSSFFGFLIFHQWGKSVREYERIAARTNHGFLAARTKRIENMRVI